MPWWAWLVVGLVLMVLELAAVDAAFYLVFLGAAAVLVGVAESAGAGLPLWGQWLMYGVLAVASHVPLPAQALRADARGRRVRQLDRG